MIKLIYMNFKREWIPGDCSLLYSSAVTVDNTALTYICDPSVTVCRQVQSTAGNRENHCH